MGFLDKLNKVVTSEDSPFTPSKTDNYQDFTKMVEPQAPAKEEKND